MPNIRIIAAAATAAAVAFSLSPAMARSCDGGNTMSRVEQAKCAFSVTPSSNFDEFMENSKPVAPARTEKSERTEKAAEKAEKSERAQRAEKRSQRSKAAKRSKPAPAEVAEKKAAPEPAPAREPAPATVAAPAAAVAAPAAAVATVASQTPAPAVKEDVPVMSFQSKNELDAELDRVQIVAAGDVNQLNLSAAPPPPVPNETVGQTAAPEQPASNMSWIGKLLLAMAGTIAAVGATRFMLA